MLRSARFKFIHSSINSALPLVVLVVPCPWLAAVSSERGSRVHSLRCHMCPRKFRLIPLCTLAHWTNRHHNQSAIVRTHLSPSRVASNP